MKKINTFIAFFLVSTACNLSADRVLTWDNAVNRVLENSPRLKISSSEIEESSGILIQSEALPNPVFSYSVENIFGNKRWGGWKAAESRYAIEQLVELGGKRGYRSQAASYDLCAVQAEYDAEKFRLLNRLSKLFAEAAAAQELFELSIKHEQVAAEVFATVRSKVEEGRGTIIDHKKAEIEFLTAKIDAQTARVDFSIAKEKLAILWGDSCPNFDSIEWSFYDVESPAPVELCLAELPNHPEWVKTQFEYLSSQQILCLEKADKIPDVVVLFGYKTEQEHRERGFVLGASFPIKIFDCNRGNIQRARSESQRVLEEGLELRLMLENRLLSGHRAWERAYEEVEFMKNSILAAAEEAFEYSNEGYRKGKYEKLEVLNAQDTLFDIQKRYIQALLNYHQRKADIHYLNSEEV